MGNVRVDPIFGIHVCVLDPVYECHCVVVPANDQSIETGANLEDRLKSKIVAS